VDGRPAAEGLAIFIPNPVLQPTRSDVADGTPRISSETRPVNLYLNFIIRYRQSFASPPPQQASWGLPARRLDPGRKRKNTTMSSIRERATKAAQSFVGLDANPMDANSRQRYLDVIAPGESASLAAEMALMSGCGLVVAGIWRAAGVSHARLRPTYAVGTAISRLVDIARSAGAWVPFARGIFPGPGDMVLVGGNGKRGPEHVFTVMSIASEQGRVQIQSVDGGQRDENNFETILLKSRVWNGQMDTVAGGPSREIVGWIDVSLLPVVSPPAPDTARSFEANASLSTATLPHDASRSLQPRPPAREAPGADSSAPVTLRIGASTSVKPLSPARGAPGADSSEPVTHCIDDGSGEKTLVELATRSFEKAPVFWGRYFTSRTTAGTVEYRHDVENAALRAAGIRVLPIARQTNRVAGLEQDGESDGRANVNELVATFGVSHLVSQGGDLLMFLDVEGNPSLSADYYAGWCKGLANAAPGVMIHPCVYATQFDSKTWSALNAAIAAGASCKGLWVAHWSTPAGFQPISDWSQDKTSPHPPVSAPVLLWQYANSAFGSGGFDCNQVNPALDLEQDLLRYLILPPA
jgi:hypothetical protein